LLLSIFRTTPALSVSDVFSDAIQVDIHHVSQNCICKDISIHYTWLDDISARLVKDVDTVLTKPITYIVNLSKKTFQEVSLLRLWKKYWTLQCHLNCDNCYYQFLEQHRLYLFAWTYNRECWIVCIIFYEHFYFVKFCQIYVSIFACTQLRISQ
jgi:hypothetical protein